MRNDLSTNRVVVIVNQVSLVDTTMMGKLAALHVNVLGLVGECHFGAHLTNDTEQLLILCQ